MKPSTKTSTKKSRSSTFKLKVLIGSRQKPKARKSPINFSNFGMPSAFG